MTRGEVVDLARDSEIFKFMKESKAEMVEQAVAAGVSAAGDFIKLKKLSYKEVSAITVQCEGDAVHSYDNLRLVLRDSDIWGEYENVCSDYCGDDNDACDSFTEGFMEAVAEFFNEIYLPLDTED